jgi:hypothetical protein
MLRVRVKSVAVAEAVVVAEAGTAVVVAAEAGTGVAVVAVVVGTVIDPKGNRICRSAGRDGTTARGWTFVRLFVPEVAWLLRGPISCAMRG